MSRIGMALAVAAGLAVFGSPFWQAAAQTNKGAETILQHLQNYSPVEKAACGPFFGRHCPPFRHWVCWRNGWGGRVCGCVPC